VTRRRSTPNGPIARLAAEEGADILLRVLDDVLSEREAPVVALRFGLGDGEPKTLDEIGKVYGVTRERIRQILDKAMQRLRDHPRTRVLGVYDETGERIDIIDAGKRRPDVYSQIMFEMWLNNRISCGNCGQPDFASRSDFGGRPRKYCSNKCRQASYRERRARSSSL
jgi:hypothetical protein